MQFSKKDLDIIFKYIASRLFGEKLSEYPDADQLTGREILPIIQGGENRNMKTENVLDIPQVVSKFSNYDTLVASSREDFNRGLAALNSKLEDKAAELQKLIESLEVTGLSISQFFGDSEVLGISQKTLTMNLNLLAQEILAVTGKTLGITLTVVPDYVVSPTTGDINITVKSKFGYLERVEVYVDDALIGSDESVTEYVINHSIAEDVTIKVKAIVLGNEYMEEKEVKKYFPYFIGAGNVYTDIMNPEHAIPFNGKLTGSFDVTVNEGEKLFIIIPTYLRDTIIRTNILGEEIASVDMNGFEIPFDESTVDTLTVFTSKNTYQAGTYNIDVTNNVHGSFT